MIFFFWIVSKGMQTKKSKEEKKGLHNSTSSLSDMLIDCQISYRAETRDRMQVLAMPVEDAISFNRWQWRTSAGAR